MHLQRRRDEDMLGQRLDRNRLASTRAHHRSRAASAAPSRDASASRAAGGMSQARRQRQQPVDGRLERRVGRETRRGRAAACRNRAPARARPHPADPARAGRPGSRYCDAPTARRESEDRARARSPCRERAQPRRAGNEQLQADRAARQRAACATSPIGLDRAAAAPTLAHSLLTNRTGHVAPS